MSTFVLDGNSPDEVIGAENNKKNDSDEDEDLECLSAETLAALKEFSLSLGVALDEDENGNLLGAIRDHFVPEKEETFDLTYQSADGKKVIKFSCKGIKRELGQTLSSTGLTVWRACDHLCEFVFQHPEIFQGKSVCELGAGLGQLSILLDKMAVASKIVATDGDDETLDLLVENIDRNHSQVEAEKLWWGLYEGFRDVHQEGFDILIAADVIYEEEQVIPLLDTVVACMKEDGQFILAFARRNVPIDIVFHVATSLGLLWTVLDEGEGGIEPVYSFRFDSSLASNAINVTLSTKTTTT